MNSKFDDIGDDLSRLGIWLLEQREEWASQVLSGECTPEQYKGLCERLRQIDDTIERIGLIRKREDRPKKREPIKSVEC